MGTRWPIFMLGLSLAACAGVSPLVHPDHLASAAGLDPTSDPSLLPRIEPYKQRGGERGEVKVEARARTERSARFVCVSTDRRSQRRDWPTPASAGYDEMGALLSTTDAFGGVWTFLYDVNRNLLSKQDAKLNLRTGVHPSTPPFSP